MDPSHWPHGVGPAPSTLLALSWSRLVSNDSSFHSIAIGAIRRRLNR